MISAIAAALVFSFFQGGFSEGAFVSGTFTADDLNGNGIIEAFAFSLDHRCSACEVLDYHMTFSGNSIVPAFQQDGPDMVSKLLREGGIDYVLGVSYAIGAAEPYFMGSGTGDVPYWRTGDLDSPATWGRGIVAINESDSTMDPVQVFSVAQSVAVPEPHPLLISILALGIWLILHNKVDRRK